MKNETVLLELIELGEENWVRYQCDQKAIQDYADMWLDADGDYPFDSPIRLAFDGDMYFVIDGMHRILGAKEASLTEVPAEIVRADRSKALWQACSYNQRHGVRLTKADRQKIVRRALLLKPDLSKNAIAKHCGVSPHLVGSVAASIGTSGGFASPNPKRGVLGRIKGGDVTDRDYEFNDVGDKPTSAKSHTPKVTGITDEIPPMENRVLDTPIEKPVMPAKDREALNHIDRGIETAFSSLAKMCDRRIAITKQYDRAEVMKDEMLRHLNEALNCWKIWENVT